MKQTTFASLSYQSKKKQTRREMDQVVPWAQLIALIEPHYSNKGRRGRTPIPLQSKLRIYFMQQWYAMSDPAKDDALYEIESMRRFAGLELIDDALSDESTILRFRHLLERHQLTKRMLDTLNMVLEERGALFNGGTTVDATIIHAAHSTKNRAKTRNPEMHQTRKGNRWYFRMKVQVGADVNSGSVHTVSVPPANAPDISEMPDLLREDDRAVFGDAAYVNKGFKQAAREAGVY
jgi:IS5 family transposase